MIKTFRGLIVDGGQDTIVLHTNDGSIGYRIVKFQTMVQQPGTDTVEGTVKIFKIEQATVDDLVDFSDNTLLGAAEYHKHTDPQNAVSTNVIFDQEIFNQDIYITWKDNFGQAMNYYIELEQIKLDMNESTVATLKDLRNLEYPAIGG